MLPRNKEAQNIRTNIKDGTIEVDVELKERWKPRDGEICYLKANNTHVFVFKSFRYNKTGASCVPLQIRRSSSFSMLWPSRTSDGTRRRKSWRM